MTAEHFDCRRSPSDWPVYYRVFYAFATCTSAPVVGAYLLMCISAPCLMKFFRPLSLYSPLILHNIICSVLSAYCLVVFSISFINNTDLFTLESREGVLKHAVFVYWMTKWYELLDTVFMVLRHKKNQISFLHVFHHATIPLLVDYAYNIACYPGIIVLGITNSFIHVIMYGYYGLTAFYPLKDFPIKKRVTQLQMTQFVILAMMGVKGYLYHGFCVYSFLYPIGLLVLFANFYYNAFMRPRKDQTRKKDE